MYLISVLYCVINYNVYIMNILHTELSDKRIDFILFYLGFFCLSSPFGAILRRWFYTKLVFNKIDIVFYFNPKMNNYR